MTTPSQCLPRVYLLERVIARCGVASAASSRTVTFRIDNPSVRLNLTIHVFARPNKTGAGVGGGAHNYTGETWQAFCVADGTPSVRTDAIFTDPTTGLPTAVGLPDTYEGATGVKVIEVDVAIVANGNGSDDYVAQLIWEPLPGGERMTDSEWSDLTTKCQVTAESTTPPSVG